jgi:hypothetical protein
MHYPEGTVYSNSEYPDVATGRKNEFGDTIFVQLDPAGKPTGRESVVIAGRLVGLETAAKVHEQYMREAAPTLVAALQTALRHAREAMPLHQRAEFDAGRAGPEWMFSAKRALAQAFR